MFRSSHHSETTVRFDRGRALSRVAEGAVAAVAFFLFTSHALKIPWGSLHTHVAPNLGDPLFNLTVLRWDHHHLFQALAAGPGGWAETLDTLWDLPIYHPTPAALLLSDHLVGTALLTLPAAALAGPVMAYNLLFFASFWLSSVVTYGVLRASGLSPVAAVVGALAFAFSPLRWMHTSHLQILLVQWIPWLLFSFDRLLARPQGHRAALFLGTYALHLTGGAYLAWLVHVPLATLAIHRAVSRGPSGHRGWHLWWSRHRWPWLALTGIVAAVLLNAALLPYALAPHDLTRPDGELRTYGITLPSLLTPSTTSVHFPLARAVLKDAAGAYDSGLWHAEKSLFPGLVPVILAIAGGVAFLRRYRPASPGSPPLTGGRRLIYRGAVGLGIGAFLAADLYTWAWRLPTDPPGWLEPHRFYDLAFTGIVLAALVALAVRWRKGGRAKPRPRWPTESLWPRGLLMAGAVSLLVGFPVVFEPLSDQLLGLSALRAPARIAVFPSFALAFLAAWGWDALARRAVEGRKTPTAARAAAVFLLALAPLALALESLPTSWSWHRVPELPPAHRWIANRTDVTAYLELPFGRHWSRETQYLNHLSHHWKPTVNGYSGHRPPSYLRLRRVCCWPVPEDEALALLRGYGASHVLIHRRWLDRPWARQVLDAWLRDIEAGHRPGLEVVYRDSRGDAIVALNPGADGGDEAGRK